MTENRPLQFRMYAVPVGEGLAFPLGKNGTHVVERKFFVSLNFSYRSQNLFILVPTLIFLSLGGVGVNTKFINGENL